MKPDPCRCCPDARTNPLRRMVWVPEDGSIAVYLGGDFQFFRFITHGNFSFQIAFGLN